MFRQNGFIKLARGLFNADRGIYKTTGASMITKATILCTIVSFGAAPLTGATTQADYLLMSLLPAHTLIELTTVVTDYVPKKLIPLARAGVWGITIVMFLGLAKLCVTDKGIANSIIQLWGPSHKLPERIDERRAILGVVGSITDPDSLHGHGHHDDDHHEEHNSHDEHKHH